MWALPLKKTYCTFCSFLTHSSFLFMLSDTSSNFELFFSCTWFWVLISSRAYTWKLWIVFGSVARSVVIVMEMTSGDLGLWQFDWFMIPKEAAVCLSRQIASVVGPPLADPHLKEQFLFIYSFMWCSLCAADGIKQDYRLDSGSRQKKKNTTSFLWSTILSVFL